MKTRAYCTILARNYLPGALTLAESIARHEPGRKLFICLIDVTSDEGLPSIDNVEWCWPGWLPQLDEREVLDLVMRYDLVEFATAIKPLLLERLLRDYEEVAYLDPDTYLTAPMEEIGPALDTAGGIALTPHYLEPTAAGMLFGEGHLLHVGVYNLGFCAVNRRSAEFLTWWWGHLRRECLHEPLAGLFVDQKWCDVGAVLFDATTLRHYGYNVGIANIHERPIGRENGQYVISGTGDQLRLFHFHAFDPTNPEALYTRASTSDAPRAQASEAALELAREYAASVLRNRELLGPLPPYVYNFDTTGRPIGRRLRHIYRVESATRAGLPSPFVAEEAEAFARWRRSIWAVTAKVMTSDLAKSTRLGLADEYELVKQRMPGLTSQLRRRMVSGGGFWG